ncbi:MAG: tRNA A-37 threonylcarbamoyl transferase component Bud32 [Paracoccaceae bacterium]|jgi:tRNA A-37 threonylcarbamoyl transferase component Bud32
MNEEHCIAGLGYALSKSKLSSFGSIDDDEKKELAALSQKMPTDLEIMKNGSRSQVGGYQLTSGREVVLKYYFPKNLIKKLGNRFRQTRCRRSWIAAHGLTHLKVPTPAALAIAEHYRFSLSNSMSFLATDRAPGTQLRNLKADRIAKLIPALRSAFAAMARFHIAHGDLKATNIIVNAEDQISFIDLDATRFHLRGKSWAQAQTYDQERFLRNWKDDPQATALLKPCFDESHE